MLTGRAFLRLQAIDSVVRLLPGAIVAHRMGSFSDIGLLVCENLHASSKHEEEKFRHIAAQRPRSGSLGDDNLRTRAWRQTEALSSLRRTNLAEKLDQQSDDDSSGHSKKFLKF